MQWPVLSGLVAFIFAFFEPREFTSHPDNYANHFYIEIKFVFP